MGSGRKLGVDEKKIILNLAQKNKPKSEISRIANMSRKMLANFFKDPGKYSTKKYSGRPKAVSARQKRATLRTCLE